MKKIHILLYSLFCIASTQHIYALTNAEEKQLLNDLHIALEVSPSWVHELNMQGILKQPIDLSRVPTHNAHRPLFSAYPALRALPHAYLCSLPTPVEKLDNLSAQTNCTIYAKFDNFSGGHAYYGGNKPRKLEFLLGDAVARGAKTVITFGCVGSNHALATAVHASRLNLHPICMLMPQKNSSVVRTNLLHHLEQGTELHFTLSRPARILNTVSLWLDYYHREGVFPYIIPTGGSNEIGTLGFVNAAFELKEQIIQGLMPEPDRIYIPCGSMGTTVGLALGCKLAGLKSTIIAVAVEPESEPDYFSRGISTLLDHTVSLLQSYDNTIPTITINDLNLEIRHGYAGPCYGLFTQEGQEAVKLMNAKEHIDLEGTYTGKAAAALLHDAQTGILAHDQIALFWITYCNAQNTRNAKDLDYASLDLTFHRFFELPVQAGDPAEEIIN